MRKWYGESDTVEPATLGRAFDVTYKEATLSEEGPPNWWAPAIQRISYLLDLPENWDSYGAKRIDQKTAYYAVQILQQIARPGVPAPAIVPTVRGYLQFEWHANGVDLEFEVLSPIEISVFYEDAETGAEWEKNLDYNLTPLTEVVTLLAKRHGGIGGAAPHAGHAL